MKFKSVLWEELCPIYVELDNKMEKIATGVFINIFNNIFLLTAAHVIDQAKNLKKEISIPLKYGLQNIAGTLYHRYLEDGEYRNDDMIDFSYYKLDSRMIQILHEDFNPLTENMIEISDDFTFDFDKSINYIPLKDMRKKIKLLYDNPSIENMEQIKYINNLRTEITITFAGYPNTKSKMKKKYHSSEQVFYHGFGVDKNVYMLNNCSVLDNILARFGEKGTMDNNFNSTNFPKVEGISGGGIYRLINTKDGLDRKLIGIGHTYKSKQHLFIGTNIDLCLELIRRRLLRELEE